MKKILILITLFISVTSIAVLVGATLLQTRAPLKFGLFELGKELPFNYRPGDKSVWAPPDEKIPLSKFFVYIAKENFWCIWESCGLEGEKIKLFGGYLAGFTLNQPVFAEDFGFDDKRIRGRYASVIIIGDQNAKIVGIYPNKDIDDLFAVIKFHPDLFGKDD